MTRGAGLVSFALAVSAASCGLVQRVDDDDLPTVTITLLDGAKDGAPCEVAVERRTGPLPDDVLGVARLRLDADRPVDARVLDDVAAEWCTAHCAHGFTLLRAEDEPGGGRTAIEVWTYRAASSSPGGADVTPPGGAGRD